MDVNKQFEIGYQYFQKKDFTKAIPYFVNIINNVNRETGLEIIPYLMPCLLDLREYDLIIKLVTNIEKDLEDFHFPTGYFSIAVAYVTKEKWKKAIRYFLKSLRQFEKDDPKDKQVISNIYFELGSAYSSIGRNKKCIKCYKKAIKVSDNDHPEASFNLAQKLADLNKHRKALRYYDNVINGKDFTIVAEAYYYKGRALHELEMYKDAVSSLVMAETLSGGKHALANYQKGLALVALNQTKDSIISFEKSVEQY